MNSAKPKGRAALPLWEALKKIDPAVECERRFDWLFVPGSSERSVCENAVYEALVEHCRATKSRHPKKVACDCEGIYSAPTLRAGRSLEFDFFLPVRGIAIEYDERQHFTAERRVTLSHYEPGLFPFDVRRWTALCQDTIQDPDPPCRDWARAFRDTVRDFRAREHGIALHRVYYRDFGASASHDIAEMLGL